MNSAQQTIVKYDDLTANTITNSGSTGVTPLNATGNTDPATCVSDASTLSYHWVVRYLAANMVPFDPYSDAGMTGFRTSLLTMQPNSLIPSGVQQSGAHFVLSATSALTGLTTQADI